MTGAELLLASAAAVRTRIAEDAAAGRPLVAHVVVALCDNVNQGIVPVPPALGNGQDPRSNLYWGAAYGVRTYLTRRAGWEVVRGPEAGPDGVLQRIVLRTGGERKLYLVAEAWDGSRIADAIERFLRVSAGRDEETIDAGGVRIRAGGAAHLTVFVGHDGLMDFTIPSVPDALPDRLPGSSVVLACASRPYFRDALLRGGSHPLLLTTGLMAPEAYTLDAVVRSWLGGGTTEEVREAAATAYDRFQKCGVGAARRLFAVEP